MLADAANLNLLADIGSASESGPTRKPPRASVTPFPGANSKEVCNVAFRQAEDSYKVAIRAAKEKRDMAVRAKNLCLRSLPRPSATQ